MPWVETLPSGKYRGGYRDVAGRKRSRTFAHKAAARRWAQDGEDAVARGRPAEAGRLTMAVWTRRWHAARVVSIVTAYNELHRVEGIIAEFGDVPLDRMSTLDIQSWEKRLGLTLGPGSVRAYHFTLTSILKAAVQERLIADNPASHVQRPPSPRGREVYLTPDEVEVLADNMSEPYATITRIAPYLGFRWGELAGLRVCDLDMLRRTAQVRQVVVQTSGLRVVRAYPKTVSSFRTVPIPDNTVAVLAGYLSAHPRGRDSLLFVTRDGQPLARGRMLETFRSGMVKAKNTKPARPHDLRHSGASWLAQAGVPIFAISKWLGHSSVQTTMRYTHAIEGVHGDVAAAFAGLRRGTERGTTNYETGPT